MRACISPFARRVLALLLALFLSPGVASICLAHNWSPPESERCPGDYLIGPEDVLDVVIWHSPEISRTVPVRPDGKISLPLVNDVQAAGLTPMQLREILTKSLASYIGTPDVSVIVREVHSFKVTVLGEVKTPGRYELKNRPTVLDVLAMAGGQTDYASHDRITILRPLGSSTDQFSLSLEKVTEKHEASAGTSRARAVTSFCLMPGDLLIVP
jgi:polysaccharide export outer membrane protein